jgi:lipoprotein-anchoring transpeptidase ErfK/SrfK
MSLFSLASVAVARDLTARGQPLGKDATLSNLGAGAPAPGASPAGEPTVDPAATTGTIASFTQMLVAQIPSEALLAYTTLLALFTVGGGRYNVGRWSLYAAAIILCAATVLCSYLVQRKYGFDDGQTADTSDPVQIGGPSKLHLPYLPIVAAALSMAVYGLTVPGSPLQYQLPGTTFAICSGCLAVGGGMMMSLFAPFLGKGNGANALAKHATSLPQSQPFTETQTAITATSTATAQAEPLITFTPEHEANDVDPRGPVSVTAPSGTLTDVQMVDDAGKLIAGVIAPDNASWKPTAPLKYGRTYTVSVASRDFADALSTQTSTFSTVTPGNQTKVYLNTTSGCALQNHGKYGVGTVVVAHFDAPILDRATAEGALVVNTFPAIQGSWYWVDDRNAHWRPEHYFAPGTAVTAAANIFGVALGGGLYGQDDSEVSFTIGDSHVSIADGATLQVSVYQNGVLVRTMPATTGENSTQQIGGQTLSSQTPSGIYTVMDSPPTGSGTTFTYATRISPDGTCLHEADSTVGVLGTDGCLALDVDNAQWFFGFSRPGDIIEVRNTVGPPQQLSQNGDWTIPWAQWRNGSALT